MVCRTSRCLKEGKGTYKVNTLKTKMQFWMQIYLAERQVCL
jgi:hypothetical protein